MNKLFLFAFLSFVIFAACDPVWDVNVDVEVNNNSSENLQVFFRTDLNRPQFDTIIEIKPNTVENPILSFKSFSIGSPSPGPVEFIIYNVSDSTSLTIKRYETELYYKVVKETTLFEKGNLFGNACKAGILISLNINDSLLLTMTKDTHLTDSIFGLKANQ